MTIGKKLDSFRVRDKFGLSEAEIRTEATAAAQRRATLAGWNVSQVVPAEAAPIEEGEYTCYSFDIYGTESGQNTLEQGESDLTSQQQQEPRAAAKPETTT